MTPEATQAAIAAVAKAECQYGETPADRRSCSDVEFVHPECAVAALQADRSLLLGLLEIDLDAIEAENKRLRGALETLHRYDYGLRASNWPGLANTIKSALAGDPS